jgi:hypothetical protein
MVIIVSPQTLPGDYSTETKLLRPDGLKFLNHVLMVGSFGRNLPDLHRLLDKQKQKRPNRGASNNKKYETSKNEK